MSIKICKNCGDEFTGVKQLCPACEVGTLRSNSDLNTLSKPGLYRVNDEQGMTATEKIRKGLEICSSNAPSCKGCPYYEFKSPMCLYTLHKEATDLLRRQQAALEKQIPYKPKEYEDKFYACKCGNVLLMKWKKYPTELTPKSEGLPYCLACGQKLDWSE